MTKKEVISVEDIIPAPSKFKLQATGDKVFRLRPMSLADRIWMRQEWTEKKIQEIFLTQDMSELCRIIYHQLENRELLKKQKVKFINEEGDEAHHEIGGVKLLISLLSVSYLEQQSVLEALMDSMGINRELRDRIERIQSGEKKNTVTRTKKKTTRKRTGRK